MRCNDQCNALRLMSFYFPKLDYLFIYAYLYILQTNNVYTCHPTCVRYICILYCIHLLSLLVS